MKNKNHHLSYNFLKILKTVLIVFFPIIINIYTTAATDTIRVGDFSNTKAVKLATMPWGGP